MTPFRWERCIHHRGQEAAQFVHDFFSTPQRSVLVVGGAGFDPRSLSLTKCLADICGSRVTGIYLHEERPGASGELRAMAATHDAQVRTLVPGADIREVDVFGSDNAPVGGRNSVRMVSECMDLTGVTDVILDCSALSIGVMFPLARYCCWAAAQSSPSPNVHLFVLDDPRTDSAIRSTSCGTVGPLHTFRGRLGTEAVAEAARLWLPQLGPGKGEILNLIHQDILPDAVCPVIPFPASDPRRGDALVEEYGELFGGITEQMTIAWNVDSRDIIYAHEKSPLDLYRSVLRIDDARHRVFGQTGGSRVILSPLGSKAVAVGMLMAALEREFAVITVEAIGYRVERQELPTEDSGELVHVWLGPSTDRNA